MKLINIGIDNDIAPCNPNDVVYNYSNISLSPRIKTLLDYGLDFCLPVYKIVFYKYFLPIESLIARIKFLNADSGVDFSEYLNKLHSLSLRYYHSFNPFKVFSSVFSRQDILLLKEFAKNKDIIVCNPDKGICVFHT